MERIQQESGPLTDMVIRNSRFDYVDNPRKLRGLILVISLIIMSATIVGCQFSSEAGAASSSLPTPAPVLERSQILVLGDVSDDPKETIREFQPLADYLAANLAEYNIRRGEVVVAPDLNTMIDYLKNGEVDLYFDSPYPALTVYENANTVPLLRRWKGGVSEYYTLLVARKDSGITTLDGLRGQLLAFEDPASTSAYLLPKAHLVNAGYKVTEQTEGDSAADDEIGYVFAGTEENVLAWILQGKTTGGVLSNSDYEELSSEEQDQLVILDQTQAVPRHIVLASSNTDRALQMRITELLLELHLTPEGQAVLESFEETSQFDSLPGGTVAAFEGFQKLFAPVR